MNAIFQTDNFVLYKYIINMITVVFSTYTASQREVFKISQCWPNFTDNNPSLPQNKMKSEGNFKALPYKRTALL